MWLPREAAGLPVETAAHNLAKRVNFPKIHTHLQIGNIVHMQGRIEQAFMFDGM